MTQKSLITDMKYLVRIKMYVDRISAYNYYSSPGHYLKNDQQCPKVEYYTIHSQYLWFIAYNQLYYILYNRIHW